MKKREFSGKAADALKLRAAQLDKRRKLSLNHSEEMVAPANAQAQAAAEPAPKAKAKAAASSASPLRLQFFVGVVAVVIAVYSWWCCCSMFCL